VSFLFSTADLALAARMEAADAENVMQMARSAAPVLPDTAFQPFAGGFAVFAGAASPMTHAVGIGLRGPVPESELEAMENFFRERGSPCVVDLCPLADASVIGFLQSRPYRVIEFNNVLARRILPDESFERVPGVQPVVESAIPLWSQMVSEAFSEYMPVSAQAVELLAASCQSSICWLAGEPEPEAGAAMGIQNGVALFYGDATRISARRKGWQSRLIRARIADAQRRGCGLAMVSVLPGSASHRNYERAGFQLIYMRVNLSRDLAS
jgi:hypothetical protein